MIIYIQYGIEMNILFLHRVHRIHHLAVSSPYLTAIQNVRIILQAVRLR